MDKKKKWNISKIKWLLIKTYLGTNKCSLNPCSVDANCQNTPGSFTCSCKDGFNGSGIICEGI